MSKWFCRAASKNDIAIANATRCGARQQMNKRTGEHYSIFYGGSAVASLHKLLFGVFRATVKLVPGEEMMANRLVRAVNIGALRHCKRISLALISPHTDFGSWPDVAYTRIYLILLSSITYYMSIYCLTMVECGYNYCMWMDACGYRYMLLICG